jgi:hypothetical protein
MPIAVASVVSFFFFLSERERDKAKYVSLQSHCVRYL